MSVQRPERLVHQENFGVISKRPRRRAELLLDPSYQKYVVEIERLFDDSNENELRP